MKAKEKITLTEAQDTLLIPLYARAQANLLFNDEKARQILASVEYDFKQVKVSEKTAVMLHIRATQLDAYIHQFIAAHPNALILHLGCGLDSRCEPVARLGTCWIDLDMPNVIALRRKFYAETKKTQCQENIQKRAAYTPVDWTLCQALSLIHIQTSASQHQFNDSALGLFISRGPVMRNRTIQTQILK
jgi:O-methyltransferase involved in polyketide biosynthesis